MPTTGVAVGPATLASLPVETTSSGAAVAGLAVGGSEAAAGVAAGRKKGSEGTTRTAARMTPPVSAAPMTQERGEAGRRRGAGRGRRRREELGIDGAGRPGEDLQPRDGFAAERRLVCLIEGRHAHKALLGELGKALEDHALHDR